MIPSYQLTSLQTCISSVLINSIQDCADCKLYTNVESLVQYTALTSSTFSKPVVATVAKEKTSGEKAGKEYYSPHHERARKPPTLLVSRNTKTKFRATPRSRSEQQLLPRNFRPVNACVGFRRREHFGGELRSC